MEVTRKTKVKGESWSKKSKKEKKKKKEKQKKESSSSSLESDGDSDVWVEKSEDQQTVGSEESRSTGHEPSNDRDEWMTRPGLFPCFSRNDLRARDEKRIAREEEKKARQGLLDKPGQTERELNPYWKDGGTGLPEDEPTEVTRPAHSVGDGGANWLRRALRRAKEQAQEEGRNLEDVAAERWGSLARLEEMLAEAEGRTCGGRKEDAGKHGRHRMLSNERSRDFDDRRQRRRRRGSRSSSGSADEMVARDGRKVESKRKAAFSRPVESDDEDSSRRNGRRRKDLEDRRRPYGFSHSSTKSWKKPEYLEAETVQRKTEREEKRKDVVPEEIRGSSDREKEKVADVGEEESVVSLTEKEMNELGAKIVKAEILGNTDLAERLKLKLDLARRGGPPVSGPARTDAEREKRPEVVVLTRTDVRSGVTRPLPAPEHVEPSGGRKKKQKVETHREGQRVRYFPDDDKYNLKQMFEKEKMTTAEDQDFMFAKLAGKASKFAEHDRDLDDVFSERAREGASEGRSQAREKDRAVREHQQMTRVLEGCQWCLESKQMLKHLIVAVGTKSYLCVPPHQSITEGHCLVVPIHHVTCATQADEDVWEEIQIFRRTLVQMFLKKDEDVVFFETAMYLRHHPHMVIECVPMPKETGDLAPIYFKKAILECEAEWSQNKKLVDLSGRSVRTAVPKGLPYFAVDFGLQPGFAHVIEDHKLFPNNFAQEIIGGMLDLEPQIWRKKQKENFDVQRKKVLRFTEMWKPFDWTYKLKKQDSESD